MARLQIQISASIGAVAKQCLSFKRRIMCSKAMQNVVHQQYIFFLFEVGEFWNWSQGK